MPETRKLPPSFLPRSLACAYYVVPKIDMFSLVQRLTSLDVIFLITLALITHLIRVYQRRNSWTRTGERGLSKPPGPPGYPIIENLFDIPNSKQMSSEIWGDVVSASVFGTTVIVINSYKHAIEMLEKRGAAFSDRPFLAMPAEVCEMKNGMGLLPYGKALTAERSMFHQVLGTEATIKPYYPEVERLGRKFLQRLLDSPESVLDHCHHFTGSVVLSIAYGYEVQDTQHQEDPLVKIVTDAMDRFSRSSAPGAFLVNDIPFLLKFKPLLPEWFPGMGWKRLGRLWAKEYWDMVNVPFEAVKKQMLEGTAKESFVSRWLAKDLSEQQEVYLKMAASDMFAAGVDTTASVLYAFFLLMAMNPEIQKKAQEEIDNVIGQDRLPSLEDMKELPYAYAIWKEVIRFHPPAPNGLPHANRYDKIYDDMFIPKGSVIFVDIWNLTHDENVYKDPMTFNPARFLGERPEQDPKDIVFGFGRRFV
ncbi:hypothetical protein D9758_007666 [Tetrapyrgos nigripes]|uniref:O-methylsterigmatocystin oxidoreductase n=1 Tax=Tetrapyrgos nigripes TaxID=182062 RepID=A0A8H5LIP6_9AGAR|nr:hypothetical protein D9758_007666 [Tetrapyrgos nigripes]